MKSPFIESDASPAVASGNPCDGGRLFSRYKIRHAARTEAIYRGGGVAAAAGRNTGLKGERERETGRSIREQRQQRAASNDSTKKNRKYIIFDANPAKRNSRNEMLMFHNVEAILVCDVK